MAKAEACSVFELHPERVAAAKAALPDEPLRTRAAAILKAIAEPRRMAILLALRAAEELCVCDLTHVVGGSVSAVSHQLKVLRDQDLVRSRREGRQVFYRLADEHVVTLLDMALAHAREV